MSHWLGEHVIATGRLPLFCFLVAFLATFGFIRLSVRMIRAGVKWWPGNVTPGGLHIHHVVFGVVLMLIGGVSALLAYRSMPGLVVAAVLFGIGSALVLDEFALILHLKDVYWEEEGRTSIDAVFAAVAIAILLLMGLNPIGIEEYMELRRDGELGSVWFGVLAFTLVNLGFALVTLLKGKIWTGLVGLFVPVLIYIGALRLARPGSPWARWFYRPYHHFGILRLKRAERREERIRRPLIRAKIAVQEFIGGKPMNRRDGIGGKPMNRRDSISGEPTTGEGDADEEPARGRK
ncbi:hypothetical protein [Salininema proteolyticum]|uniref:Integral membrane protein n=1 Tax=Salininema proteolyticum TaxID=1607685 RepID=A0ABV8U483_9ACTN